ncbi:MAG: UDP-N-acetylmuramate--L-alanine ligase [Gammaproteobacteria bacterium]|nr:UDP-N-acetylmuramate--L-alanine ligase [Gammaproteobacteria bacterium]
MTPATLMHSPMRRIQRIHLLGIGGSGMAGIAEVLINLGYQVTGTDLRQSPATDRLSALGAVIGFGHDPAHTAGADAVVVSTAVKADNPELVYARAHRVPVVRRAEMLAELMRFRFGIAIAGTHGKTTPTSLVASVLAEAGLDPTYVIGGQLKSAGANARLGQGTCLVAEADESDASFLHLSPMLAAVTNIDADHLETYGGDFNRLRETFVEFLQRLPFYGLAILCADDAELTRLIPRIGRPITTYGFAADADVRVLSHRAAGNGSDFRARLADGSEADFHLNLPGRHNVQNALVALVIGQELGADVAAMARALKRFEGVGRRCEHHGRLRVGRVEFDLVDDYGHHPRELAATFEAMRSAYPGRRLVVAFQPHRYSRTRDCFDDFSAVLSGVDALVMTEVYAAGETPIEGADARALARSIRAREQVEPVLVDRVSGIEAALLPMLRNDDVVLTLGAGDIGGFAPLLAQQYRIQGVPA